MRSKNKTPPYPTEPQWVQPTRCQGCIWGRLEGTKQFCSLPRCMHGDFMLERR
ncbi:hypothetical protein [Paenibacillus phocaensis]|uniref:hypothetical protein n=1 Tax=Paenibacillus phocaensis TaxID=1776378 RepID=UPI000AC694D8|nr:hypothetical protein [Paenibacillus phocaensis]